VNHGASPNAQDIFGFTPIMLACIRGNLPIVQILTGNDCDIDIKDKNGTN